MCFKKRIDEINEKIKIAAEKSGRKREDIKLVAVTKKHPAERVDEVLKAGIKNIGENRPIEAMKKIPNLKEKYEEFHFIGHLQSNKINKLLKNKPDLIHSIDKFSTAKKLNKKFEEENQEILIQVNTSGEVSKEGCEPEETLALIKKISELSNIKVVGLMTISTLTDDDNIRRNCFRKLKKLFDEISSLNIENIEMKYLSMGMSSDYEIAIEEGSNLVRIGTAIIGKRKY